MGLNICVITPDGLVWEKPAVAVVLPSTTGQLGILKGHTALITALEIGVIRIKIDQKWEPLVILGGLATIKDDIVTVLVSGIEDVVKENYEEAQNLVRQATEALSLATTTKEKKRATSRLEAYRFL
jgi:F-type H+-transporting ATPase subunit epsilon